MEMVTGLLDNFETDQTFHKFWHVLVANLQKRVNQINKKIQKKKICTYFLLM